MKNKARIKFLLLIFSLLLPQTLIFSSQSWKEWGKEKFDILKQWATENKKAAAGMAAGILLAFGYWRYKKHKVSEKQKNIEVEKEPSVIPTKTQTDMLKEEKQYKKILKNLSNIEYFPEKIKKTILDKNRAVENVATQTILLSQNAENDLENIENRLNVEEKKQPYAIISSAKTAKEEGLIKPDIKKIENLETKTIPISKKAIGTGDRFLQVTEMTPGELSESSIESEYVYIKPHAIINQYVVAFKDKAMDLITNKFEASSSVVVYASDDYLKSMTQDLIMRTLARENLKDKDSNAIISITFFMVSNEKLNNFDMFFSEDHYKNSLLTLVIPVNNQVLNLKEDILKLIDYSVGEKSKFLLQNVHAIFLDSELIQEVLEKLYPINFKNKIHFYNWCSCGDLGVARIFKKKFNQQRALFTNIFATPIKVTPLWPNGERWNIENRNDANATAFNSCIGFMEKLNAVGGGDYDLIIKSGESYHYLVRDIFLNKIKQKELEKELEKLLKSAFENNLESTLEYRTNERTSMILENTEKRKLFSLFVKEIMAKSLKVLFPNIEIYLLESEDYKKENNLKSDIDLMVLDIGSKMTDGEFKNAQDALNEFEEIYVIDAHSISDDLANIILNEGYHLTEKKEERKSISKTPEQFKIDQLKNKK